MGWRKGAKGGFCGRCAHWLFGELCSCDVQRKEGALQQRQQFGAERMRYEQRVCRPVPPLLLLGVLQISVRTPKLAPTG